MIAKLQSIDPQRLGIEEGASEDTWIALEVDIDQVFFGRLKLGWWWKEEQEERVGGGRRGGIGLKGATALNSILGEV